MLDKACFNQYNSTSVSLYKIVQQFTNITRIAAKLQQFQIKAYKKLEEFMYQVVKRDGKICEFKIGKIAQAIKKGV